MYTLDFYVVEENWPNGSSLDNNPYCYQSYLCYNQWVVDPYPLEMLQSSPPICHRQ